MAFWYVDSAQWSAVTAWATGAKTVHMLRRQSATPTAGNERVFVCIVAGTSGGTEPTWVITKGAKTTDSGATWQECTGQPAVNGDAANTPNWNVVKNTAVALGFIIKNVAATFYFICTTAGTAGNGAEPTWNTTAGVTTTDNTITWTSLGAVSGFTAFQAPHKMIGNAYASTWGAAGDTFFVGDDHAETPSGNAQLACPGSNAAPCVILCVDHTVANPGSSNLKTTGTITTTGGYYLVTGYFYIYGITLTCAVGDSLYIGWEVDCNQYWDTCKLAITSGGGNHIILGGDTHQYSKVTLSNTPISFGSTGNALGIGMTYVSWINTPNAVLTSVPTNLFDYGYQSGGTLEVRGVDLSALGSGNIIFNSTSWNFTCKVYFIDCKLGASVQVASTPGAPGGPEIDLIRCDSGTATYRQEMYRYSGSMVQETTVVRTGGASDGTTTMSWKITTTANSRWIAPFITWPVGIWNSVTGARTVTLVGIWNAAALPNNDDIWMTCEYLGSGSSPLTSVNSQGKASYLAVGAAQTTNSSAWDSIATARINSHTYSANDVIKLASNSGRIFFCTVGGAAAASEPGGYASAVDGGSVTDGAATFRAGVRFQLSVTLSPNPALVGYLRAYVNVAKASSTFWVDPLITLS